MPSSPTRCNRGLNWVGDDGRSLFVHGSVAVGLRAAIDSIPVEDRDEESIDSLLDDYCVGAARPIAYH